MQMHSYPCPDWVSANGTRIYSSPMKGDERVISGESGSVTMGLVAAIMTKPELKELKEALKLDENSQVLLVSSEGDTILTVIVKSYGKAYAAQTKNHLLIFRKTKHSF